MFFFRGLPAVFVKSDLEIPAPIPKILSLYLHFAIGFKGGVGLAAGVSRYSVIKNTTGKGERGGKMTGVFTNSYFMTACPPEKVTAVVESLRPTLKQRGRVCLVSDALWLIH